MLYYPFGVRWQNTTGFGWDEKFAQFPQRDDDIQKYEASFREYAPGLGRWMSPDRLAGNIMNPQSLDRYTYALNNPVSNIDPLGLFWHAAPADVTTVDNVGVLTPQASEFPGSGGSGGGGGGSSTSAKNPCHGGQKDISPAEGQKILNASQQFFNIPYDKQDCSLFVCNSINASNVLPYKINRVTAQHGPVSISLSKDFKAVPSTTQQPADVMVFSNPKPYHMGFYAPHPPSPKKLIDIFLSSTVHGNGGLGGPRYLPQGDFSGSVSYYRLQEPCHE